MTRTFAAVLLLLAAAWPAHAARACDDDRQPGRGQHVERQRGEPRARVRFAAAESNRGRRHGARFDGTRVRSVLIVVDWKDLPVAQKQRLEVFAPDGTLYQTFSALASDADPVETRLPVAGTWITQHSLFGQWCVAVYLDGEVPVTRAPFTLQAR